MNGENETGGMIVKRMRSLACALLALMWCCCGALAEGAFSEEQMQADLSALRSGLEFGHKNLFAHVTQAEWDAERQRILDEIPELTPAQFYYELRHLVAMVGDAHTSIDFAQDKYHYLTALPFAVAHFADGWRLLMLEECNQAYLGFELTAIDGVPIEAVFERSKAIISCENDVWARQQFSNAINFLEALQYLDVTAMAADSVTLTVRRDADSPEEALVIPGMDEQAIMSANIVSFVPDAVPQTAAGGIYRALAVDEDCLFIQYNSCQEAPDMSMQAFADAVRAAMEGMNCRRLIFDLRYNTGGDSSVLKPLIEALAEYREENQLDGYVLIGADTFSSAILNAVELQEALDAVLVGEPTGGSVNGYGEILSFSLNNMPLDVYYSTKYFEMVPGYPAGESLMPDMAVESTFEDYRSGRDAAVEAVLAAN